MGCSPFGFDFENKDGSFLAGFTSSNVTGSTNQEWGHLKQEDFLPVTDQTSTWYARRPITRNSVNLPRSMFNKYYINVYVYLFTWGFTSLSTLYS